MVGVVSGAARRSLRVDGARSQAVARLPQHREHRDHSHGLRLGAAVPFLRTSAICRAGADRRVSSTRLNHGRVQVPSVPGSRRSAARHAHPKYGRDGWPDPAHAVHGFVLSDRRHCDLRTSAAERFRERVVHLPGAAGRIRRDSRDLTRVAFPIAGALLALTAALAAACFVKAFGITFLALPRSEEAGNAGKYRSRCAPGWRFSRWPACCWAWAQPGSCRSSIRSRARPSASPSARDLVAGGRPSADRGFGRARKRFHRGDRAGRWRLLGAVPLLLWLVSGTQVQRG